MARALLLLAALFTLCTAWLACNGDEGEDSTSSSAGGPSAITSPACTIKNAGVLCECAESTTPNAVQCPGGPDGGIPTPVCCDDRTAKKCSCQIGGCEDSPGASCTCSGSVFNANVDSGVCPPPPAGGACCLNASKSACTCFATPGGCPPDNTPVPSCSLGSIPALCGPHQRVDSCSK